MPGQPNRKPGVRARPVGNGVPGMHEIDASWGDTDDPKVLKDRLRRYKAQVLKVKQDRSDLRAALRLKTEEAFVEGQLSIAPQVVEIKKQLAKVASEIVSGEIDEEKLKVLKVALQQLDRWEDRTYGKTRQRVESTSSSFTADLTELMNRGAAPVIEQGDDSGVVEGEIVDEELIDE